MLQYSHFVSVGTDYMMITKEYSHLDLEPGDDDHSGMLITQLIRILLIMFIIHAVNIGNLVSNDHLDIFTP